MAGVFDCEDHIPCDGGPCLYSEPSCQVCCETLPEGEGVEVRGEVFCRACAHEDAEAIPEAVEVETAGRVAL